MYIVLNMYILFILDIMQIPPITLRINSCYALYVLGNDYAVGSTNHSRFLCVDRLINDR